MRIYICLLWVFFFVSCQEKTTQAKQTEVPNLEVEQDIVDQSHLIKSSKGILHVKKKKIDKGTIKQGTTIQHDYVFHNVGSEEVEIIGYQPSCNCSELKISKFKVSPKDSLMVTMLVETSEKTQGEHKVSAVLKTSGQRTFYDLVLKFSLD